MKLAPTLICCGLGLALAQATSAQAPAPDSLRDRTGDFITAPNPNPIDLRDPAAVTREVEYDPATNRYLVTERIGDGYYRSPTYLTFEEYAAYQQRQQQRRYFDQLQGRVDLDAGTGLRVEDPIEAIDVQNSLVDRLFGGSDVNIEPRGNIDLTFGVDFRTVKNPAYTIRQQRNGGFNFDMGIQMNVTGSIGSKLKLSSSYNNQANFNFDRQLIKVTYNSAEFGEDEIIQNVEAGNVSLPLRSNLIQGSQGLLGIRVDTKFGHLRVTGIASQQKTERDEIEIKGGAQFQEFEVRADEYDENRHFLLSHYNRATFEDGLQNLPTVLTQFKINRIEVWITNDRNQTEGVRQIAAISDLGESLRPTPGLGIDLNPGNGKDINGLLLPDNDANGLYQELLSNPSNRHVQNVTDRLQRPPFNLQQARDFERVTARLLAPTEYTFHPELGFVSVNVNVRPDQVLAVAYEYTYNGRVYKVGEFSNDLPVVNGGAGTRGGPDTSAMAQSGEGNERNVLFTRLLKATTQRVDIPLWDLMMKNFYNIGAYQVNREDFLLDITYEDPGAGQKRFLPSSNLEGVPLIRVFGVDQLNIQLDPQPDGIFDFVPGLTIYPRNGRIMFPSLEPFGDRLREQITDPNEQQQELRYVYDVLYDSTVVRAREYPEFNRFIIRGSYKSSVSDKISLGAFNVPRGSVRVSAGGQVLREGIDYEINYGIGQITILNDAYLNSGVPVRVSFEDNAVFGLQNRSMVGLRADYDISKKLSVGGTYLHLFERPFTQKVNVGDDPINNRIYGLDLAYGDEAPWLTRFVDKIPGLSTKEASSVNFTAEAAFLKPGHSKAIDIQRGEGGTVYVDDFEGSASGFDLKQPVAAWQLASTPQGMPQMFPEARLTDSTAVHVNRALLNWYRIDQVGRGADGNSSVYAAQVRPQDLFPNRQLNQFTNNALFTFDLTLYPEERGPYNFDVPGGVGGLSAGLGSDGLLLAPRTRWGGVTRDLTTNDFQAANIEYLEFWVLSPYLERGDDRFTSDGDLYIEFGNISEDIMRDSRLFFEQGLPGDGNDNRPVDFNNLGRIPRSQPITPGFDTDPESRELQDVGFDGLNDDDERAKFSWWLDQLPAAGISQERVSAIRDDPANDNFVSFTDVPDSEFTPTRYRGFNGFEGNSPISTGNDFAVGFSTLPDTEDVNGDNTLSENEAYFQYRIPLVPDDTETDGGIDLAEARYVTQVREIPAEGDEARMVWYRFKVPLDQFDARVGSIQDFRSIRFMRMYMTGFETPVTLRFARLDLVRNQWRRYLRNSALLPPGPQVSPADRDVYFDVDAVNIDENSGKEPFNYTLPLGIQREQQLNTVQNLLQNEQSQAMTVCGLPEGQARAIYKLFDLDMRVFDRLRMFVHAENYDPDDIEDPAEILEDGDLSMFIRIGSDFQDNYYEYELPLAISTTAGLPASPESDAYRQAVWLQANEVDIALDELIELKKLRNASGASLQQPYGIPDPSDPTGVKRLRIIGNPNLGLVKGIMIGLRNARGGANTVCAQVWVNELRLNGLDERGGAAGQARLDMQLADFGSISASGSYASIGWGSLDQKLAERARESTIVYDVAGTFELGKFLPEASGIRVPATVVYSDNVRTPEFDPYDLDITLKDKLRDAADPDSIREQAVTRTVQRELNFTNVRKERTGQGKPMPWDVSNFSASYVYNETDRTSPLIELDDVTNHYGALDYNYALRAKYVEPFKKLIKNDKYFNLLRDFNFNPVPTRLAVSTVMDRTLQATRYRFTGDDPTLNTFYNRNWTWDRDYTFNWDLSRALRFQFNATNRAVIDEAPTFNPDGEPFFASEEARVDSVWANVLDFGRNKAYQHRFDVNYTVPLKQLPLLDFANVTAQYSGTYTWNAAAQNLDSLGNVITNGNQRQIRGDFNFETLYRKSKYLQRIENGNKAGGKGRGGRGGNTRGGAPGDPRRSMDRGRGGAPGDVRGGDLRGGGKAGRAPAGSIGQVGKDRGEAAPDAAKRLPAQEPGGALPGDAGGRLPGAPAGVGADTSRRSAGPRDPKQVKKDRKAAERERKLAARERKREREREVSAAERALLRPLLLLRRANVTYSEEFGTTLPGFMPDHQLLGLEDGFGAPGWDFVAGLQPDIASVPIEQDLRTSYLYRNQDWFTSAVSQNQQVFQTYGQNLAAQLTVEPFKDFRIDFDLTRRYTENHAEFFKDTIAAQGRTDFQRLVPTDVGSYTISYGALNTLFGDDPEDLFDAFEANRLAVSQRLNTDGLPHQDSAFASLGYLNGFGPNQQNVQLGAFLAAYTEQDASTVDLDFRNIRPRPNWRITYNGLARVKGMDKLFASFSLQHSYKSSLTVNTFNTNLLFDGPETVNPTTRSYYSRLVIPDLVISEQFSPLIGVDARLKNDMSVRFSVNKSRNLGMSFVDNTLAERQSEEYSFGYGYTIKNVDLLQYFGGKKKRRRRTTRAKDDGDDPQTQGRNARGGQRGGRNGGVGNDLDIQCDIRFSNDVTFNRLLDQQGQNVSRGSRSFTLSPSAEYEINRQLSLRVFLDYRRQDPYVATSFPTRNTQAGVTVRFKLN